MISEAKIKVVINNYFKHECDVNTSIREAFEKGFRLGVKKWEALTKSDDFYSYAERKTDGSD